MKKGNNLRTHGNKTIIIFTSFVLLSCIGITLLFVFIDEPLILKIFVYAICAFFFILALFLLMVQLFDYIYVEDECLIHQRLFFKQKIEGKAKINVNEITKVIYNKGAYEIYVGKKLFCFLDPMDAGGKMILLFLEQHKVSILTA